MATTVSITLPNYTGKTAGELFRTAWEEGDTLKSNVMKVYPGVNGKITLRKIQTTSGRREYTCGHVPNGGITLSEIDFTPKKFKDDWDLCKEDFRATYWGDLMGDSAHNDVFPKPLLDGIIADQLENTSDFVDNQIWNGVLGTGQIQGLIPRFVADATVVKVAGVAITQANVLTEMGRAVSAIPQSMKSKKLNVMVSSDVAEKYNFNLISNGVSNGLGGNANTELVFGKHRLIEIGALPANTIVIAETDNLAFMTGLTNDFNRIDVSDEDAIGLLTGKVRGTMVYSLGVGYIYGAEIVYYRFPVV